jgi:hypothetical protein
MLEEINLENIRDEEARKWIIKLLNIIEGLQTEIRLLKEENQRLRDENNRLKGEQGKPNIKGNIKKPDSKDISSEKERYEKKEWKKGSKKEKINITREVLIEVDKSKLPSDAKFKGYEYSIVQDIKIELDNILFRKEKYYSASEKKTYIGENPSGYEGDFGPGIKSEVITQHYRCNMTEPKILEYLEEIGVYISAGEISNLLIKDKEEYHKEKEDIYKAGINSSSYQNIDDTKTRENGKSQHCHIIGNENCTCYFTTEKKDRLTVLEVLMNFREVKYLVNDETIRNLEIFKMPVHVFEKIKNFPWNKELSEEEFKELMEKEFPTLGKNHRTRLLEAAGIAYYHNQLEFPIIELLVCDDAPQFKFLTEELGLCWVHEGRHYKKLEPKIAYHREILDSFIGKFWEYYKKLLKYKLEPKEDIRIELSKEFDELFSTVTGYDSLDKRIALTKEKKENLLKVLFHPEIPLHNNSVEIEARIIARLRDISFGTRTNEGTKARDTFLTLLATTKKLGLSFYRYIYDRVTKTFAIPNLGDLIKQKSLQLGNSGGDG